MKEKQIGSGMGAGGISILAIFVVLCLATLAALSLVSARADRNLAEKNAQASVEYYQADARAEEILHELLTAVQSGPGWEEAPKGRRRGRSPAGKRRSGVLSGADQRQQKPLC